MVKKQASSIIKKYKAFQYSTSTLIFLACIAIAFTNNTVYSAIALIVALFLLRFSSSFYFRKFILSSLLDKLDAPLYNELAKECKLFHESAIYQLQGEYSLGNYQNVVSICEQQLKKEKIGKQFRFLYLSYLAEIYFDTDNKEKLKEICFRFNLALASESNKDKILKRHPRMAIYTELLDGVCNIPSRPEKLTDRAKISRDFLDARIYLMRGETDEAKRRFEKIINDAPKLNYAKLAAHALEAIENGVDYGEGLEPIVVTEEYAIPKETKAQKFFRKTRPAFRIFAVVIVISCIVIYFIDSKERTEYEAYLEEVRVMVEKDRDGVEVLTAFNLEISGETADSMFICTAEDRLIVASSFSYTGEDDTMFYETKVDIPISALDGLEEPLICDTFNCSTTYFSVESCFFKDKKDMPLFVHLTEFEFNGSTVYFAVTEINVIQGTQAEI